MGHYASEMFDDDDYYSEEEKNWLKENDKTVERWCTSCCKYTEHCYEPPSDKYALSYPHCTKCNMITL